MDFLASLKAEIEAKKKQVAEVAGDKTYIKVGEMEARRQKEYEEEQFRLEEKRQAKKREQRERGSGSESESNARRKEEGEKKTEVFMIPAKEVIRNLRRRGEPIRLFGETDEERIMRLRALEAAQPELDGQLNEFHEKLSNLDRELDAEALKRKADAEDVEGLSREEEKARKKRKLLEDLICRGLEQLTDPITAELYSHDEDKLYRLVHDYFKRLVIEWEDDLDARPDHVKRSLQGKIETVTMQQARESMKPFFKLLKHKQMPPDIMQSLAMICEYMQQREYVKANDTYYLMSIGNSPWPIGVTMVGIHERSAREKIFSHQVAHVLNDEKTRKWIQSLKRIMTYCQNKYLPDDLSKMVGYVKN